MSTMTRKPSKTKKNATPQAAMSRAGQPRSAEAPDRGAFSTETEAPETRRVQRFEAPDAGEGRAESIEHEFTHGRSQS